MKGFQAAFIFTIALAMGAAAPHAQTYVPVTHDSVYVYNSWEAILDSECCNAKRWPWPWATPCGS